MKAWILEEPQKMTLTEYEPTVLSEDMVKIREQNLFKTVCPEMVRCATETLEEMID